jgi:hypothetical protein
VESDVRAGRSVNDRGNQERAIEQDGLVGRYLEVVPVMRVVSVERFTQIPKTVNRVRRLQCRTTSGKGLSSPGDREAGGPVYIGVLLTDVS